MKELDTIDQVFDKAKLDDQMQDVFKQVNIDEQMGKIDQQISQQKMKVVDDVKFLNTHMTI